MSEGAAWQSSDETENPGPPIWQCSPIQVVDEMKIQIEHIPGSHGDCGHAHGANIPDLVEPAFLRAYVHTLARAIGFDPSTLRAQGFDWLDGLPVHYATEIEAMACGAGVELGAMVELLYADIARPDRSHSPSGPMCSAIMSLLGDGKRWIGRNCDWLTPILTRGVSAVVHEIPNRIPIMAVGIRGDIDLDTGLNAEGLWLHLHTLHATDTVHPGVPCISWLFWAREALETCASLDELERFIDTTARDRGVMVVASEGRSGQAAVFECSRSAYLRHDADARKPLCVTNHPLRQRSRSIETGSPNASGTISRRRTLEGHMEASPPVQGPDDIIASLGAPGVEMRTPRWLRTIYSAVADPSDQKVWFAAGTPDGQPAASSGRWSVITPPWTHRYARANP